MTELTPSFWLACGGALLLWGLLLFAEWRLHKGGRLLLRALLLFMSIGALLLAWLRPVHTVEGPSATILLNGNAPEQLDSLLELYPAATVYSLQPHERYTQIEGMSYLHRYLAPGSQLFLLGEGLTQQELPYVQHYQLSYLPSKPLQGVLALRYQPQAALSDSLQLQGSWRPRSRGDKLLLTFGRLAIDSIAATRQQEENFQLQAFIRLGGEQLYRLYWLGAAGDTLDIYLLPLSVEQPRQLQLALLTAYPESESKYLKEHLQQQGHRLYYAAQLAPGKQLQEWINLPRQPLRLNRAGLRDYDILILSISYWRGLSRSQQQLVEQSMVQDGLGLLLYPDTESNTLSWKGQSLRFSSELSRDTLETAGSRLPMEYRRLEQLPSQWDVLQQARRGTIVASRRVGLGKLLVSGGVDTYRLLLSGKDAAYAAYWQLLLGQAMPMAGQNSFLVPPQTASERYPLRLSLFSRDSLPEFQLKDDGEQPVPVAFWQSPALSVKWEAFFRPRKAGWYTAVAAGDTLRFKVEERPNSLLKGQFRNNLQQHRTQAGDSGVYSQNSKEEPIPFWWFYVAFLVGMGGLWLERKLRG